MLQLAEDRLITDAERDSVSSGAAVRPGKVPVTARLAPRSVVLRKADGAPTAAGADAVSDLPTGGAPLPESLRERFEASLGTDLGDVRVHTGTASATAATQLQAKAFAIGSDIHFGAGQFRPADPFGMHLIAHEVAHTVQQRGGSGVQTKLEVSEPGDALELEADRAADAMVAGAPAAVSWAGASIARTTDLDAAADRGGQEARANASSAPANLVSNVSDRHSAEALLGTLSSVRADLHEGVRTKQVEPSCLIANSTIEVALQSYLESAEQQNAQIETFQGLFITLMGDFGRLNEMSKAFDGYSLADMKDKEEAEKHGDEQAKEIFHGEDAAKLKERAAKIDPSINDNLKQAEIHKQVMSTKGRMAVQAGNELAAKLGEISTKHRQFDARADAVTDPTAQAKLFEIRKAAKADVAGKAGGVIKDAIVAGVGGAKGGPAAAGGAAAANAATGVYNKIIKPKLDEALEKANIDVGVYPNANSDLDKVKADMAVWAELKALGDAVGSGARQCGQKGEAVETALTELNQARELYRNEMIAIGKQIDRAVKNGSAKPMTREEMCGCTRPKPRPATPDKGPRFETAMQFLAEADRFIAQAEVADGQGQKELLVVKTKSSNSTSDAHRKISDINSHAGDLPSEYFYVVKWTIKNPEGKDVVRMSAHPQHYEVRTGANPTPSAGDEPNEADRYGSAEGSRGKGANEVLTDQIERLKTAREKIAAYRARLAGAIGV